MDLWRHCLCLFVLLYNILFVFGKCFVALLKFQWKQIVPLQLLISLYIFMNLIFKLILNFLLNFITAMKTFYPCIYSQTCIERPPLGRRKCGLMRHVTYTKRFNSHIDRFWWQDKNNATFWYRWQLNRGEHMDRFDCK